ncbi:MAG: sulfotransferase [Actinobacteria bacterium]|nr:MAG: sulfotransferase [Actinomycetota bacterium]
MPEKKEPRFFAGDLRALIDKPAPGGRVETLEEYVALFEHAQPDQRVGEASPSYLRSETAAREIAAYQPQARIIAILREPASFVRSLHFQLMQGHVELEKDLRRAFAAEEIVRQGKRVLRYSDHIRYVEQLRRYEDVFGREQMMTLIYDDFRADNEATVREVLRFLEVDDAVAIEVIDANPTVDMRSRSLDRCVRAIYAQRGPVARAARTLIPSSVRRGAMRTFRQRVVLGRPRPADEEFMLELRHRFKGEVVALGEYLDRDLVSLWGYEGID